MGALTAACQLARRSFGSGEGSGAPSPDTQRGRRPSRPGRGCPTPSPLVLDDRDRATLARRLELDDPLGRGEDRVVAAEAGALAGPEAGAALADDDLAAGHLLPGEDLDAEHLGIGF